MLHFSLPGFVQPLTILLRSTELPQKIAIIAALEREIAPLVKHWPSKTVHHEGHEFTFFKSEHAVAVCGGIGGECARRAAEAAIIHYSPRLIISAGIAGALVADLKVGDTISPAVIVDIQDGSRRETAICSSPMASTPLARTLLVTHHQMATVAEKMRLAISYGAHAVDMEAAEVARAAQLHNLPFVAVKAISDEHKFAMPEMQRFIHAGQFDISRFLLYVAVRPWLWIPLVKLARNTRIACDNLCAWLRESVLTNTIVPDVSVHEGQRRTY